MLRKGRFINIALLLGSTMVMFFIAEHVFRRMVFRNGSFKELKDPGKYADAFNEADYWKLYTLFGGEYQPPEHPHPLLGWKGSFMPNSLMHDDLVSVGARRPVLLYGDSYAQCMPGAKCFQEYLNNDSVFSAHHFLLNYGVGGYGVDQIALLCENTFRRYARPVVIFSLMATDMDRSPLDWRTGQKPYFSLAGDSLALQGVPIDSMPWHYLQEHGVGFGSYLWRRFLFSEANLLPQGWTSSFKCEAAAISLKKELNVRILDRALRELRASGVDFFFVVFHYVTPDQPEFSVEHEDNWRDELLRGWLSKNHVPHVWMKDVIKKDPHWNGKNLGRYMILENGHPNTYLNGLLSREMERMVLAADSSRARPARMDDIPDYTEEVNAVIARIHNDPSWFAKVQANAVRDGVPLDTQLFKEGAFVVEMDADVTKRAIARAR